MRRAVLADAAGILLFTTVGLASHELEPAGYARNALPLLAAWIAVGAAVGLYRRPSWARLLATWAVAVPLAWAARAVVLGRSFELAFLAVSLVFTLVFVVVLRLLARSAPTRSRADA